MIKKILLAPLKLLKYIILAPLKLLKYIILAPIRIYNNIKATKEEKKLKNDKLYVIEQNILLAKKYNLDLLISNNYNNEIIINMSEKDAKKATTKKVKDK